MAKDGILSGIRVIDCATYIAAPHAASVLSDFGAEVLKIERPPGGDLWRLFPHLPGTGKSELNWSWILSGRNRKSVAIDLAQPEGREVLVKLVRTADVFVSNYQVEQLKKFRITWDDLSAINPRLIYAHLSGYGETGEDADLPAFDALAYWARSGLLGTIRGQDGSIAGARAGIGDNPTAMSLFGAIMLGLYNRERTGKGAKVGTSLLASGAWANSCDLQVKLLGGSFPERTPGQAPANPLILGYLSSDQKVFFIVLLDPDHEFPRLCEALGISEIGKDPMFSTIAARAEHAAELYGILQSQFESRTLGELKKLFKQFDIKWSSVPTLDDVIGDAQMRECGAFVSHEVPGHGEIETINSPVFVDGVVKRRPQAAPEVGSDTRGVLRSIGYSDDAIDAMIKRGVAIARD